MTAPRFTVEPIGHAIKGYGVGTHGIRYRPPERKNEDGSTRYGMSFFCLLAGDMLGEQEETLQTVADVLNASEIGK